MTVPVQDNAPPASDGVGRRVVVWSCSTLAVALVLANVASLLGEDQAVGMLWAITVATSAVLLGTAAGFRRRSLPARLFAWPGVVALVAGWVAAIVMMSDRVDAAVTAIGAGGQASGGTGVAAFMPVAVAALVAVLVLMPGRMAVPASIVAVMVVSAPAATTLLVPQNGSPATVMWPVFAVHLLTLAAAAALVARIYWRHRWLWSLIAILLPPALFALLTMPFVAGAGSVVEGHRQYMVGGVFIAIVLAWVVAIVATIGWGVSDSVRAREAATPGPGSRSAAPPQAPPGQQAW